MTYMLNSIDEAIDGKYLVTQSVRDQAPVASMVHIMDAWEDNDGAVVVDYRVTDTGASYVIKLPDLNHFYKWARPDTFIARYYESFSKKEINNYIKMSNRNFVNFALPIMIVCIVIIMIIFHSKIVLGIILSVVAAVAVYFVFRKLKSNVKLKMYQKVSNKWGIEFR
ncbi:MAG: hypothetical protein IJ723_05060 [Ruminococcus sp.]|nr:hypothetical protein [Ruminococcus sp.]